LTFTTHHAFCGKCEKPSAGLTYTKHDDGTLQVVYSDVCRAACMTRILSSLLFKETDMIDPTPRELDGLNEAKAQAADYLTKTGLMGFPLGSFSPEQVEEFLRVIIGGYTHGVAASDEIPF
jgi:hypothetical protein